MDRRGFISKSAAAGMASAMAAPAAFAGNEDPDIRSRFGKLDRILKQPVFRKHLFSSPVIIDTLDLLVSGSSYICRVRSKDGAEGISVAHNDISFLVPIFLRKLKPFFLGQDARELDLIIEKVYNFQFNFRYNGIALGIPLATIEFAILDMMGRIAGLPMGQLIGDLHNTEVGVYCATEFRELPLEEHFAKIDEAVAEYDFKALKIKIGYMFAGSRNIHDKGLPGKSEKLIPMVRNKYGEGWSLYADSNGYYDAESAIKIGRLLEEYKYSYFEEPVMFDNFLEIKKVSDALTLPVANGEQDNSFYNFRWLIANDGIEIVQPDNYYFGGFIRSMKVALMAHAFGKACTPHMSGGALGYLYNIHFVSVLPNAGQHHEFKGLGTQVQFSCPTSPLKVNAGKIKVPTGPGNGIDIDPDFINRHKPL
ncbi:MAG: mandelate racemase/muconate lactonizing enzyme family protein [Bacteroidales bacterium]|jgi:L-alanine-DL-glutamate epimerase-like enolase superfamily enzyme|nr:mandelate racemase/muconate lactonizing enzyme family protein [Bacteroidales bacterium]